MLKPLLVRRCGGLVTISIAVLVSLSAHAASKSSGPAPTKSSGSKHCLWRVSNGQAPFYLLGSIHILRAQDYPVPSVIDQAIQQSQQFYFEYAPNRSDDFSRKMEAAAKLPSGVQIKDKVHAKTWDYLRTGARGGNYDWVHLKAWAIAKYVLDYPTHDPFSSAFGLDNYVVRKAEARRATMRGLESVDDHVAVFAGMNDVESEAYLLRAIVYASGRETEIREAIAAWRVGNTERLNALQAPSVHEAPGLDARFLEWRNARWIPVIESAIKSGTPTMIVAGAAHFSGPHSVLNLLRARGYQIEQL
jgi:uncharacterized protein YbaP (TraB family)